MAAGAERLGFSLMVGCMVATSLSMAPAVLVAQRTRGRLDGPLPRGVQKACATRIAASIRRPPRCGVSFCLSAPAA